jgi:hypothetical protein
MTPMLLRLRTFFLPVILALSIWTVLSWRPDGSPIATTAATQASLTDRYGIFIMGSDGNPAWAPVMGLSWVIGPGPGDPLPAGVRSLYGLPVNPVLDESTLRGLVAQQPAAHWYIENEPNVSANAVGGIHASVDQYARGLNYYARVLKRMDPKARLLGPNIMNWDFTCIACGGYVSGRDWTIQMRDRYRALFRTEPPLDIWTIHSYDLDWQRLPQGDAVRQIGQILGLRTWLDGISGLRHKPIWVTEIGYHWNYPGLEPRADAKVYPSGDYAVGHLDQWMREVFGWLNAYAGRLNIQRWFAVLAYTEALESWMGGTRWPGIVMLDGPLPAPSINRFGRLYQQFAGVTDASATPVPPQP